ncbi:DUF3085 domain-containing protein [Kitasatospora sp. NPDC057542]|uniref:DUF3085 domain-containing protein n=1 Tax=Kitasatospora sp. NPDC057542 TaxID=3346162 RepID=UPI0036C9DDE3
MPETLLLRFPLADILPLAEHAAAASDHRTDPYSDASGACLIWVKDDGTYIMSNGLPHLPGKDIHHHVVHADGWGPGTENELRCTPVGGDDFAEYFPLNEPLSSDTTTTMLDQLRAAVADGLRWLELEVSEDSIGLAYSD